MNIRPIGLLLIIFELTRWSSGQLCSVFQPFKVTPDNAKYQIGGPFPLHTEDCLHVRPEVVQELIGVQWALSKWNQNAQNAKIRLALSAFDTCSRGQESLTQTMAFLHESGFLSPKECRASESSNTRVPLGLIMPMAQDGRLKGLKDALMSVQVPIISYSGSTAQALFDADVPTVFSTAPTLDNYMEATIGLLKSMQSDLITLIYSDQHLSKATLDKQLAALSKSGIAYSKASPITDPKSKEANSSEIILMIASKDEAINYFMTNKNLVTESRKLFVLVPALGESWSREETDEFLIPKEEKDATYRLVLIQQGSLFLEDDFRDYFLDILRNNYETYVLLATYMQQEYNCTLIGTEGMIDCEDVETEQLLRGFRTNRVRVESAVLATFVYGALAKYASEDRDETCATVGPACTEFLVDYLTEKMTYVFGEMDPPSYRGFAARFGADRVLSSLPIEGLFVRREEAELLVDAVLNHTTNGARLEPSRVHASMIRWSDGEPVRSRCEKWRPECQPCADGRKYALDADRSWIQKPSQLYVLGMFDMRQQENDACNRSIDDPRSITMPAAFVYALENARRKHPQSNLLPAVEVGGIVLDTCNDRISTMETLVAASSAADRCLIVGDSGVPTSIPVKNVIGIASGQRGLFYDVVKKIFQRQTIKKPFVGSNFESTGQFRTESSAESPTPTYDAQSKVLVQLLLKQSWEYVSVLLSEHDDDCLRAYESFRRMVEADGRICIADVVHARSGDRIESIRSANAPTTKIALAFTTAQDTIMILKTHQSYRGRVNDRPVYVFVGESHDWEVEAREQSGARSWKSLALGAVSVQFKKQIDNEFRSYLTDLSPKTISDKWFVRFWEDYFKCSTTGVQSESSSTYKKACTGEERLPADRLIGGRLTREAYFVSAVESMLVALDAFYKKACPRQDGLCDAFFGDDYLTNVIESMASMDKGDQFTIYSYRPDTENVNGGGYAEIATWTNEAGLKFNDTLAWYDTDRAANQSVPISVCKPPSCHCRSGSSGNGALSNKHSGGALSSEQIESFQIKKTNDEIAAAASTSSTRGGDQWKQQTWTYIFLIINTILLLAASLVLTIVSVKLCCGVVKGNQSLGICLLFGVILLYITAYFFIFDACESICRLRYIAHTFSYAVCFGVMIAKAVQLRNSETLGFNGYISFWNYWLLLFFIAAVQMALSVQWAIVRHPIVVSVVEEAGGVAPNVITRCSWTNDEFLASQIYVILLLSMAIFLALLNRNVKRNYKETRWLLYTSFLCACIWVAWMIGYTLTPHPFKETVVVMELMTCATVILCFMFGPKLYILLRYESILSDTSSSSKLASSGGGGRLGGGPVVHYGAAEIEKRNSIAMATAAIPPSHDDVSIREFEEDDEEDGRGSVLSAQSGKSGHTLTHTVSSASSVVTCSDDSTSPVYPIRKKSKGKQQRRGGYGGTENRGQHRTIFEETMSSVH